MGVRSIWDLVRTLWLALYFVSCGTVFDNPPPGCVEEELPEAEDPVPFVTEGHFTVALEQGGRRVSLDEHEATIERAPFDLVFELRGARGIWIETSLDDRELASARDGQPLVARFRPSATYVERLLDADRDLMLDRQPYAYEIASGERRCDRSRGHQYLYWDDDAESRFSSARLEGDTLVARRRVENIARSDDPWAEWIREPLESTTEPALYIVLLEDRPTDEGANERTNVRQRAWARLTFR